jgi:hypothetical protein
VSIFGEQMAVIEQIHAEGCQCWKCLADHLGRWIDALGSVTGPECWQVFATITYSTKSYPWCRGFPVLPGRPKADFAHHLFDRFVLHLESELRSRVDYVVADQLGSINGRFHQHAVLAALGLDTYPRTEIWKWLIAQAGWSRILPFEQGAAYYISRYIGRDANRCDWFLRVGEEQPVMQKQAEIGRVNIVHSADLPREFFKQGYKERKR